MRKLLLGLLLLLVILQITLWFGGGGLLELWEQHQEVEAQRGENARLRERNEALNAEAWSRRVRCSTRWWNSRYP
jgi:cell division protein FtsB